MIWPVNHGHLDYLIVCISKIIMVACMHLYHVNGQMINVSQ